MKEIIITDERVGFIKKDLELIWGLMSKITKEKGVSDLTLNLEGSYYNFRDNLSAMLILKSIMTEASNSLSKGNSEEALEIIFKGLEIKHEYFESK